MHSAATLATARYSASALERDTIGCHLDDQETRASPRNTQKPDVDLLVSGQPVQSASEYAVTERSGDARRHRPRELVSRTYRSIRFSSACVVHEDHAYEGTFAACWTANARSGRVTVRYRSALAKLL